MPNLWGEGVPIIWEEGMPIMWREWGAHYVGEGMLMMCVCGWGWEHYVG